MNIAYQPEFLEKMERPSQTDPIGIRSRKPLSTGYSPHEFMYGKTPNRKQNAIQIPGLVSNHKKTTA
ncbi:hypothetical protein AYI69_g8816 [Smittium culicis]|uniref:Uncharacterized protein n=1 Tax=Smittium culicis TaxID=133412 RepID=A0A1R1XGV0_9FUNG|nr:hypothetical protein AYI69_g8816 [Smittium culicis]